MLRLGKRHSVLRELYMKARSGERLGLSRDEAGKPSWACERQVRFEFNSIRHRDLSETIGYIRSIP